VLWPLLRSWRCCHCFFPCFAAWGSVIAGQPCRWLSKRFHHRSRAAALITVLLVLTILAPLLITTLSLSAAAVDLGRHLAQSKTGGEALEALAAGQGSSVIDPRHPSLQQVSDFARQHGASALGAARTFFGAISIVVLNLVVFVAGFYVFFGRRPPWSTTWCGRCWRAMRSFGWMPWCSSSPCWVASSCSVAPGSCWARCSFGLPAKA
jgi:hypothetical protein